MSANARLLAATGLPPAVTTSIENWDDLLRHGSLVSDSGAISVEQPLKPDDQAALRARFP